MGVGLGQCGRDPEQAGREHRGAGYVPARAENEVGTTTPKDPHVGREREGGDPQGARERESGAPREPPDADELNVDLRRREGAGLGVAQERDARPARPERFRDRERRQHVSGCSAGGDQELRRRRGLHS
jgi:hypothetical protein